MTKESRKLQKQWLFMTSQTGFMRSLKSLAPTNANVITHNWPKSKVNSKLCFPRFILFMKNSINVQLNEIW